MSIVDQLRKDFSELTETLRNTEISLLSTAEETFRKALLLAAASYFEKQVLEDIVTMTEAATREPGPVVELVRNKVIVRQYHSLFDWNSNNANKFFSLFGADFKEFVTSRLEGESMQEAVSAFMEIGRERNRLVHGDFGSFPMEKTADEVYELYQEGVRFVESLGRYFQEFEHEKRIGRVC